MSVTDPTESADPIDPGHWDEPVPSAPTLAARRPGHAAMTHLLHELGSLALDAESLPVVPPALLSWHIGVIGEQLVGHELAMLPEGWRVFHAIPAGSAGADIDHLVIGPGGVLVLNTKHHANKTIRVGTHVVWIDGFQQSGYQRELLRRCTQTAAVLHGLLPRSTNPRPLLVFVRPKRVAVSGDQPVESVPSSGLVSYLLSLPQVLDAAAVEAITRRVEQPSAWGAPQSALAEVDPTMRFLSLRVGEAVEPSRGIPERTAHPRNATARQPHRTAQHGVGRVLALGAVLMASVLVLPAAVAMVVAVLGLCLRMLTGS